MFWEQNVQHAVETDIGLQRKNNEDSASTHLCRTEFEWRNGGHLFVVADGMGGHAVGELASQIAVETLSHCFMKTTERDIRSILRDAVVSANEAIHKKGTQNEDFLHMGTTCTALALCSRGALIAHVGDSRAYRVRRDRIDQLTFDHSLEWELEKKHKNIAGVVDLSKHRNVITRSLGPEATVEVDLEGPFPALPGDTYVLCSDGLSNQVNDEEIGAVARELSPQKAARLLIHLANVRGGPDNSTVVIARVGELPANVEPTYVEEEPDDADGPGWAYLIGFWVAALALCAGLWMIMFDHPVKGWSMTSLAVISLTALTFSSLSKQRAARLSRDDSSATQFIRAHRMAVCLDSKALYERLSGIDHELHRAAKEDGWSVNWKEHQEAVSVASKSADEKRYSRSVRYLAKAIGSIMDEHPIRSKK